MKLTLRAWYHALPLKKPYRLSFAVLEKFETLYIALEGDGRMGIGEVTPLPGYGTETIELAIAAVQQAAREFSAGKSIEELSLGLCHKYPFTASGLACAYETWAEGQAAAFDAPLASSIPLAALCPGDTPAAIAAEARRLLDSGVTVLKLKAGRAPELEESSFAPWPRNYRRVRLCPGLCGWTPTKHITRRMPSICAGASRTWAR